jgi:hypothetical protein
MARPRVSAISEFKRILMSMQGRVSRPHAKFSYADDQKLRSLVDSVDNVDNVDWNAVADEMDGKNPRQCRERWINYLAPDLNTEPWTTDEDALLVDKYRELGSRWVQIAYFFPNRTDCMVKNRFHKLWCRERKNLGVIGPPTKFTCQAFTNTGQSRPPSFLSTQFPSAPHRMDHPAPPQHQRLHKPPTQVPDSQLDVSGTRDFGPDIWYQEGCSETFDLW